MKIPPDLKAALENCPLPWECKNGRKHIKLFVAGQMVGTFSGSGKVKVFMGVGHAAIIKRIKKLIEEKAHGR